MGFGILIPYPKKKSPYSESYGADFDIPLLFGGGQLLFGCLIIFTIIVPVGLIIFVIRAVTVFSIQVYLIDDTAQDCTVDISN